jgi:NAD(P)-dependent dehydrogenase (short-subunit alcohol dehydrogenase family)
MQDISLKGGVIVSGGAQGIGRRIVLDLAAEGVGVTIADTNVAKGNAVVDEAITAGGCAQFVACDVARSQDCERVVAQTARAFGGVRGLVNNASIFSTLAMRPFWEISDDEWDNVLAVNLKGVWQLTKAALPELKRAEEASVVNISSSTVFMGRANYAHYVASKAGVIGLSRAMARELGEFGVRVNALTPGPVFTEVPRATVTEAQKAQLVGAQSLKREGRPDDIAAVVGFLLGPKSGFVTGQTVNVDGGMMMR